MADKRHEHHDDDDHSIPLRSGFDPKTRTFHCLKPPLPLPPPHSPLSCAQHALSLRLSSPWSSRHPDSPAFISLRPSRLPPLRISYSQFCSRVDSLSAYLRDVVRLRKGDVAFVLSPNTVNVPVVYFSLLSLGVVVSPANPAGTVSEITRQVGLSRPLIAFTDSGCMHKLPPLRHGTVVLDSLEFESICRSASSSSVHWIDEVEVKQSDLAAILYSSGTTGLIKGVALTHRNLITNLTGLHATVPQSEKPAVLFYTVPYFHVFGFVYFLKSLALCETSVITERFQLGQMLAAVDEYGVTHIAAVPPVVIAMTKCVEGHDLRTLVSVTSGGAPLGQDLISTFNKRFPRVTLSQGYGLTECTGGAFRSVGPEESSRPGSTGMLIWNCEARIVDPETGESLAPCKEGELWVRGPGVMEGYVGDPEATAATITADGWLKTGDLCYIDEEGFLYVVDRLKELIKYKGYQVAPAELEQLLQSHPEIADAAVVPFPDEEAGEIPMAFVARQAGSNLNEAGVIKFIEKQVAPYKKVRKVEFVSGIPRSAAGKILRKELRKTIRNSSTHLSKL
ncbi:hypothetical protein MLD38_022718 [Melastoma candidum]|uniref:Uncharacterized protein n=1 Tax=Melastoma candidum TaxID=119954 RepID=A0ACB9QJC9_9MYRT|nr:hypothetical protein MLD38_022718 [Melastoma candidum]